MCKSEGDVVPVSLHIAYISMQAMTVGWDDGTLYPVGRAGTQFKVSKMFRLISYYLLYLTVTERFLFFFLLYCDNVKERSSQCSLTRNQMSPKQIQLNKIQFNPMIIHSSIFYLLNSFLL